MSDQQIDTSNDFLIGVGGNPPRLMPNVPMVVTTKQQAKRTAAWLLALSVILPSHPDTPDVPFEDVLTAVSNT